MTMNILDSIVDGALALPSRDDSDALIGAVVRFMRIGEEPEALSATASAAWTMIAPVLVNSRARSEAGRRGGKAGSRRSSSKAVSKPLSKPASKTPSKSASEQVSSLLTPNSYSLGVEGSGEEGFEPPSLDEVEAYFAANCLKGDPVEFRDHFEAQGWVRGNGMPVIDWRAAARQWSRRQVEFDQSKPPEMRAPVETLPIAENARDWEAELAALDEGPTGGDGR